MPIFFDMIRGKSPPNSEMRGTPPYKKRGTPNHSEQRFRIQLKITG